MTDGNSNLFRESLPPPIAQAAPHVSVRSIPKVQVFLTSGILLVLWLAWLGYRGREVPFLEMRLQHTDSTGYQPLPDPLLGQPAASGPRALLSSVPRAIGDKPATDLTPALPDLPDGSIPAQAKALTNPLASDPGAIPQGAEVYIVNCQMCHGRTGHGDGAVGESYTPRPPDLNSAAVRALPDGELYYSITNGILSRPIPEAARYLPRDWHAFRRLTTDHQRWAAVRFIRYIQRTR